MTRAYRENIHCPHCGKWHTVETAFERWMRDHPRLDSRRAGIVRFDCDVLLHKYMMTADRKGSRIVQGMMFIEVKTHDAELSDAQRDTLSLLSQVLRNRRDNIHAQKIGRHADDHTPITKAYSHMSKGNVQLRLFGGHLLTLSGDDPVTSRMIRWDYKPISIGTLESLLRFDVDPDKPQSPMGLRRRSEPFASRQTKEFDFLEGGYAT